MIAKSENTAVSRIRLIVIGVLVTCTVGVAFAVWYLTTSAEQNKFEENFGDDATKVFEALGSTLALSMSAIDAFVVGIVSFARYTNSSWPHVTVPDYATRMAKIRSLSKAVLFLQYQIVRSEEERTPWEEYSLSNGEWVDDALEVQKKDTTYYGLHVEEYDTSPLHGNFGPIPNNSAPYYPMWQGYPVVPIYPPFNWDGSEYLSLARAIQTMEREYEAIIGSLINLPDPADPYTEENVAGMCYHSFQFCACCCDIITYTDRRVYFFVLAIQQCTMTGSRAMSQKSLTIPNHLVTCTIQFLIMLLMKFR